MTLCRLPMNGFVLAGGMSRRMGKPKQNLILDGETMLARQLRLLRSVCSFAAVVGISGLNAETPSQKGSPVRGMLSGTRDIDAPVYPDEWAGHGPLGGIYTGLLRARTEFNFFLSCDMPFLCPKFLRYVGLRALAARADVAVPESSDHQVQPLCAVYRRRARGAIRASLARNENKTTRFYPHVHCEIIRFAEIARAGFGPLIFTNMNTPEDYESARKRIDYGI